MARVIFVNRFYWPAETATGQLLTDLAEALVALGHEVTVITSRGGAAEPTEHRGVRIVRIRSTHASDLRLADKALDWSTFLGASFWAMLRHVRRGDVLVALTDPPLLAIGAWLAARCRGARLVHWVQDIYPEIAIELAGQRWLACLRPLRNMAWRAADQCVTLGRDMAATLSRQRVPAQRISIIGNWPPAGVSPRTAGTDCREIWGLRGKFVVAYSGNLGRVHDLGVVADLAEALREDAAISLLVVGDGAQRESLQADIARRGLANVMFRPAQPRAQLAGSLATGDVHLVTLRDGCEHLVFPSKLYGIAAVGRPVLFIGPAQCEVARCVREHGLGCAVSRGQLDQAAAFVRALARDPAEREPYREAALAFASRHGLAEAARSWDRWLSARGAAPA